MTSFNLRTDDEDVEEYISDHCMWLDNCDVWYNPDTDETYDALGNRLGNFQDIYGDHPKAIDPEAFGVHDENEFIDLPDVMFRFIRNTREYKESVDVDEPQCMAALSDKLLEEENLNSDTCKLIITYDDSEDLLSLRGFHPKIGPVWSETTASVTFPTDYVELCNKVLDLYHHCETVQSLTHGCAHCWKTLNVNPVDEIADEYACTATLVEDLVYASDTNEIKGYGPIQPDCHMCMGVGIDSMGGWDTL